MNVKGGDYVLEQEDYALKQIKEANMDEAELKKLANEAARQDLKIYDEEKQSECEDKMSKLASNYEVIEEISTKKVKDLKLIKDNYEKNKAQVIEFLFKNVIDVKFEIPNVVKGNFEEIFGIKKI